MRGSIRRRLEGLEGHSVGMRFAPAWSLDDMVHKVLDEIDFALATNSPVDFCKEELAPFKVERVEDLPEEVRSHVDIRPATWGTIRRRYKDPPERPFVSWRERVRDHEERVRAFEEESRRRDQEHRRAFGFPPPSVSGQEAHPPGLDA